MASVPLSLPSSRWTPNRTMPAQAPTLPLNKESPGMWIHGGLFTDRFDFYVITTNQNGSLDARLSGWHLRVALY